MQWGIADHDSAVETIEWIFSQGHRTQIDQILHIIHTLPVYQHRQAITEATISACEHTEDREYSESLVDWLDTYSKVRSALQCYRKNKFTKDKIVPHSIAAWDYVRAAAVPRWCCECGYISEEEMWEYIERAQTLALQDFHSWQEYGLSFILGRGSWRGDKKNFKEACKLIKILLKDEDSPWQKPWQPARE